MVKEVINLILVLEYLIDLRRNQYDTILFVVDKKMESDLIKV